MSFAYSPFQSSTATGATAVAAAAAATGTTPPQARSLRDQAGLRADHGQQQPATQPQSMYNTGPVAAAPPPPPSVANRPAFTSPTQPLHPLYRSSPSTPAQQAETVRREWRRHGSGLSQLSEEKRRRRQESDAVVRIVAAEPRRDLSGASFTAYLVSIIHPGTTTPVILERRYSEFAKLHSLLRKHAVSLDAGFPSKHWAGRLGNWTPSLTWAPTQHEELVHYRKTQLDLWLVDLVARHNRTLLPREVSVDLQAFLSSNQKPPAERDNELNLDAPIEQSLRWSNPLSFTLGSSIRQAAYTVQYMCLRGLSDSDQSIPLDLLRHAQGLCFLTVVKGGLVVSGKVGTGLVIAKRGDGSWSAPSAMGTVGLGWGAQIGGDITHYLVVLTTVHAVEALYHDSSLTLGAAFDVAVGPVGRGATSHISSSSLLQPAYAYAHSHGLFAGISLEGSVLTTRHDVNTKFYGQPVEVRELLNYRAQPKAAAPLYQVLQQAMSVDIPTEGIRPMSQYLQKQPSYGAGRVGTVGTVGLDSTYTTTATATVPPPSNHIVGTPPKADSNVQQQQQQPLQQQSSSISQSSMLTSQPVFGNGMMSPTVGYVTPSVVSTSSSFDRQPEQYHQQQHHQQQQRGKMPSLEALQAPGSIRDRLFG